MYSDPFIQPSTGRPGPDHTRGVTAGHVAVPGPSLVRRHMIGTGVPNLSHVPNRSVARRDAFRGRRVGVTVEAGVKARARRNPSLHLDPGHVPKPIRLSTEKGRQAREAISINRECIRSLWISLFYVFSGIPFMSLHLIELHLYCYFNCVS